jgi:hypothetical protein
LWAGGLSTSRPDFQTPKIYSRHQSLCCWLMGCVTHRGRPQVSPFQNKSFQAVYLWAGQHLLDFVNITSTILFLALRATSNAPRRSPLPDRTSHTDTCPSLGQVSINRAGSLLVSTTIPTTLRLLLRSRRKTRPCRSHVAFSVNLVRLLLVRFDSLPTDHF